ncbi:MAG: aconitase family protein, partial [Gammaproteobacteria bacterium]
MATAVLSGNRNFEGRMHAEVKMNYLMSPPLVVAYALAGTMDIDLAQEPLGKGRDGQDVFLKDVWPSASEVQAVVESSIVSDMFKTGYADVFAGDERWQSLPTPEGDTFAWDEDSTYVRQPPYFENMPREAPHDVKEIRGARAIAYLGDSVTTDHISPAG